MKVLKKMITILLIFGIVFILLNYIPIKFAKRVNVQDVSLTDSREIYVCQYTQTTDGVWLASREDNILLNEPKYFKELTGNDPFLLLSDEFTSEDIEPSNNKYVFAGKSYNKQENNHFVNIMDVEKWDIVYPINRKTVRYFFTPKNYLTIYDFNWNKVLDLLLKIL